MKDKKSPQEIAMEPIVIGYKPKPNRCSQLPFPYGHGTRKKFKDDDQADILGKSKNKRCRVYNKNNYLSDRCQSGKMGFPKTLEKARTLIENVIPIYKELSDYELSDKMTSDKRGYGQVLYEFAANCERDADKRAQIYTKAAEILKACFEKNRKDILAGSLSAMIFCRHLGNCKRGQKLIDLVMESYNQGNFQDSGHFANALLYCGEQGKEKARRIVDDPSNMDTSAKRMYVRGLLKAMENHLDEAVACFEQACEIDPFEFDALYCVTYYNMKRNVSDKGLHSWFKNAFYEKRTLSEKDQEKRRIERF